MPETDWYEVGNELRRCQRSHSSSMVCDDCGNHFWVLYAVKYKRLSIKELEKVLAEMNQTSST